jgi:hypothetical protein
VKALSRRPAGSTRRALRLKSNDDRASEDDGGPLEREARGRG